MFNKYLLYNKASSVFLIKGLSKLNSAYLLHHVKYSKITCYLLDIDPVWNIDGVLKFCEQKRGCEPGSKHGKLFQQTEWPLRKQKPAWVPGGSVHSHCTTHSQMWSPTVKDSFSETGGFLHRRSPLMNRVGKKFTFMIFIHKMKLFTHSMYECSLYNDNLKNPIKLLFPSEREL